MNRTCATALAMWGIFWGGFALADGEVRTNLLPADAFETDERGQLAGGWRSAQHSSDASYEFSTQNGELSIRRTGDEPWGQVTLQLDPRPLAGQELEFSVEVAGDFRFDHEGLSLGPPGIEVIAEGRSADLRQRMMGSQTLLSESQSWDVAEGAYDWTPLALRFVVPETASRLRVAVTMTLGGELRVRNPRLVPVSD